MRTVIITFILIVTCILTLTIHAVIVDEDARMTELRSALDNAAEESLETADINEVYTIDDEDELVSDFIESFMLSTNANYESIEIDIVEVDLENGLFSVSVTETFKLITGWEKEITAEKTVFLEEYYD